MNTAKVSNSFSSEFYMVRVRIQSNLLTNPYVNVFAFPYIDEITGSSCKYSV